MSQRHPCLSCGACCAYFRVQFYWREAEKDHEHHVPQELTEDLDDFKRCMKGTNQKHPITCVALKGRIGTEVGCTIYENRPTPCRKFEASYETGKRNKRCDDARAAHGLKALKPEDFPKKDQEWIARKDESYTSSQEETTNELLDPYHLRQYAPGQRERESR